VPHCRTVFLDPASGLKPYANQWDFLASVRRVSEKTLDEVIELNDLTEQLRSGPHDVDNHVKGTFHSFGLPPCAQRMLAEGVTENQRVACFRLAVDLKKAGVPLDAATAALQIWALKNRPADGKGIITRQEIMAQVASAYSSPYRSCGCDDPAVLPYCSDQCTMNNARKPSITGENGGPADANGGSRGQN